MNDLINDLWLIGGAALIMILMGAVGLIIFALTIRIEERIMREQDEGIWIDDNQETDNES